MDILRTCDSSAAVAQPEPDMIFLQDPIRILQMIGKAARLGQEIEETTLESMSRNARLLPTLPQERVTDEFSNMLQCNHPGRAMRMLLDIGALQYIIPEFMPAVSMTQNKYHDSTVWEHSIKVLEKVKSNVIETRLAALLHDIGKIHVREISDDGTVHFIGHELESAAMADEILHRMLYPEATVQKVNFLVKNHMKVKHYNDSLSNMRPKRLRKLMYLCGDEATFMDLCDLIHADNTAHIEGCQRPNQIPNLIERAKDETRMYGYRLPIDADDVAANLQVSRISDIEAYMNHALTLAFAHPTITKDEILRRLRHFHPK